MICLKQYGYEIPVLRRGSSTYDLYDVPDITNVILLKGDFSWAFPLALREDLKDYFIDGPKESLNDHNDGAKEDGQTKTEEHTNLVIKNNSWETFRENPILHKILRSPTASYVSFSNVEDEPNLIAFYRDQQDCIVWAYNTLTGYVYASSDWNVPIANTLEEFWFRQWIESILFYKHWGNQHYYPNLNKLQTSYLIKYEAFYLYNTSEWIAKDIISQWIFKKRYDGSDIYKVDEGKITLDGSPT
ncbi:MAG: hypothetical protein WD512_02725, partial [Candidatus Paceibacterota bacterium]